ncbi:hypothetical protein DACRYDRAFT_98754 [Dacryopinax primogenitus]|uniref:26S proteasome complex subunit SEM1 n=1 Tax=Dacryopinax primogenitus (strain DJM 731) TaxID=1858805 RepID=M5GE35_DACPD|nr:uncharacterized protein DACRYDRAFT_98754 [Dacryopinax primogenitus]EJU05047.1 hypothetical protein DACRYDRAFT_98754 [Dacryopinax primogenitus]
MSSTTPAQNASSSTPAEKPKEEKEPLPQLGALEEDDEFEEFETQDWEDPETDLAFLKSDPSAPPNASGSSAQPDSLWEENWDDDDVDDDFSKLLRVEIEKTSQGKDTEMGN